MLTITCSLYPRPGARDMDAFVYVLALIAVCQQTVADEEVHEDDLVSDAVPGTFFWKSDLALRQSMPTVFPRRVTRPNRNTIRSGYVVFIDGYQAGLTIAAVASMREDVFKYPHLNPRSAYYYTNMYRWLLRFLDNLPAAIGSKQGIVEMHKVWRRRFTYNEAVVPQWIRKILFFVKNWDEEQREVKRWNTYAAPGYAKYMKYPSPKFNNWNSMRVRETVENLDTSRGSV